MFVGPKQTRRNVTGTILFGVLLGVVVRTYVPH
jgi:hypothetical protein